MKQKGKHVYEYPRPAVTVDCVVFGFDEGDLKILLIKRKGTPFEGDWALPGGFVRENEALDDAAERELAEETGIEKIFNEQLYTFGDPGRDPRGHVITVAYYALVRLNKYKPKASTDAADAKWQSFSKIPKLAFDHKKIANKAIERLRNKVRYEPIGFELLPEKFSLSELQHLYEVILGVDLDKRNFRKKILATGILKELDEYQQNVAHRAARLYKFDEKTYNRLVKEGFNFEL